MSEDKEQIIDYQYFYEKSRLDLTVKLNIFLVIALSILAISFSFLDTPAIFPTAIGILCSLVILVILKRTNKYKVPAAILCIVGCSLTTFTLIGFKDSHHFMDPLWMTIISIYAYFTLGKLWGNITFLIQSVAVSYFILFMLNDNLTRINHLSEGKIYALVLNAIFAILIIVYLINEFIKRNTFVYEQYKNITLELQQKNILVLQQNDEKTAMLKEIHHRVKNNLQVVTSLLRLQSKDIENEAAKEYFKEATDRVSAMALIHNKMYQSDNLNQINLQSYLENLAQNIIASYSAGKNITASFDISINHLPSNTIVPIALIFNELLSNSIKHGFKDSISGEIIISISEKEGNKFYFNYKDNGTWQEPKRKDSFGLELIETLVEQLNGNLTRKIEKGTMYDMYITVKD